MKVLIVDDERGILDFMRKALQFKFNCETLETVDGTEAVALFAQHRPDVCVLDVNLDNSKLSGVDVLREVRKIDPNAKCIMVTRVTEEPVVEEFKRLGAALFLPKPMGLKEFINAVQSII